MRIVHASDLHFGEIPATASELARSAHFFTDKENKPQPKDLSSIFTRSGCFDSPDVFVVSGDVGWSGIGNDYKYFHQFIDSLKKKWTNTAFIFAPGNHDLDLAGTVIFHEHSTTCFSRPFHQARRSELCCQPIT